MANVISRIDQKAVVDALRDCSIFKNVYVTEKIPSTAEEIDKFELGVNWYALGTVSVEDAKEFQKELELRISLAKKFNDLHVTVNKDFESKCIHSDDEYEAVVEKLEKAYQKGWFVSECEKIFGLSIWKV